MSENGNGPVAVVLGKQSPLIELGSRFSIEPAKLMEVLRGTVIKPDSKGKAATNEEVAAFCIVANQYGLNPFTREIHAFTSGDKGVVPIVGIDGWTHIVNGRPDFDGCEFMEYEDTNGAPVSVKCIMYVKGRQHPVMVTERFSECKRNTIPWQTMPWRMLRHKAYMQAARYAFGLSGIYDEDEGRDIIKNAKPVEFEEVPKSAAPGVILSARMGAPAEKPKADEPKPNAPSEPKPEPKPEAQDPGPQPANREALVDELRALMGPDSHVKASAIDAAMKAVGVNVEAGESWEQLSDDKLDALAVILKDDTAKQKRSRKTA